jgi:tetratricopeptide (TPR) repeat protein
VDVNPPTVQVRRESIVLPSYLPAAPDKNPMFLEKRVYQGSNGRVYPLPFIDRIAETKKDVEWDAVHLENDWLYVMILPQIGGRIHVLRDKTNGYDLIYNQPVIKPALVGLAGPWASGGIEFNWPQHHRPSTFMPADVEIEKHPDGSVTVWLGDHDPMARMKSMHGVCLHPDRAVMEVKVRAHNRTPFTQTFLWWANVATRVHEHYQSFFPPDVYYVADHAKRATSEYPLCRDHYYGVDYGARGRKGVPVGEKPRRYAPYSTQAGNEDGPGVDRPSYAPNDLSWYANIPVPTSYMCMGSKEDFCGGYDYKAKAGLLQVANHHIAPGKKQWTWGNHEFGYAWDRNLADADADGEHAPYIELMAGVFTDNQPDFSFLQPGETKSWSLYWAPIREIGAAQHANIDAAVSLRIGKGRVRAGVSVTRECPGTRVVLECQGQPVFKRTVDLSPAAPFVHESTLPAGAEETTLRLLVLDRDGRELIAYAPKPRAKSRPADPATEPAAPSEVVGSDELFLTGLHLDQYRHATRSPVPYWEEALRRDPGDSRCRNALGLWHLKRGEFTAAEVHFRRAVERLTRRNPNPYDGEAYYNLGLCLRFLCRDEEAYDAFYKATWNQAWKASSFHALAEIDCVRADWAKALCHLDECLRDNPAHLRARDLKAVVLRQLGRADEASSLLDETLTLDPLDWWARYLAERVLTCDNQTRLDLSHDCARAGLWADALDLLTAAREEPVSGTTPMIAYTLAWIHERSGNSSSAKQQRRKARQAPPDYCFPARLEDISVLESAMRADPIDARAPYYLGNLLYDRRRHYEAIALWEKSAKLAPDFSIVWRNLGIGYFNISGQPAKARAAYERAFRANPDDARLFYERDQLWKRLGATPVKRLREFEKYHHLTSRRDDLAVELCALYNQTGQPDKALAILKSRKFQPWEGGEGQALGQHTRTHLALGRRALASGDAPAALAHFQQALDAPENLGEARHLLANASDIWFWLGEACTATGDKAAAKLWWRKAAEFKGDFQLMSVRAFSEMTFFSIRALERLGRKAAARKLATGLLGYGKQLAKTPAEIDYFATSLPSMLLFDVDLQVRQTITARFLEAQASLCLGHRMRAARLVKEVLAADPNHAAADLLAFTS